jgi:phospholipase C
MASQVIATAVLAATPLGTNDLNTKTPIKHVIVIYGENRSFDRTFGMYRSPSGEHVQNILSEGIVNEDGTPGPNFSKATQYQADATSDSYSVSPKKTGPYQTLPPPIVGGNQYASNSNPPPFATIQAAADADYGLLPRDLRLLTTGATGLPKGSVDTRINNV